MLKARVAVLVSGGGTNLQALIDAQKAGQMNSCELTLVVSSKPDAFALTRAAEAGIPTAVVDIKSFTDRSEFEKKLLEVLCENIIDMIVLAGFMYVLSRDFVSSYLEKIVNVHPSLIPAFCGDGFYGLRVHKAVLDYGVKVTGATVHYVNEITDGGKIILQKAVEVKDTDTPESLQQRVMREAEWVILPKACEIVARRILNEKETERET
ncbi:MAG: phosphoribosylglycinamide formyltransferase [Eubacteriales bacterium]|nr:phosphoribosylglycinamide formyltransferase [Eubacteriales bacterium]MDD4476185.1 phosphoribosylglycinamide formyltransferase [Eubacteriales bacterium]